MTMSSPPDASAPYAYDDIAKMVDHSLLAPTLDHAVLEAGLEVALAYRVASVCIVPHYVARAAAVLAGSAVRPTTTVGFPHGAQTTAAKLCEAECALSDGAVELDAVVNVSRVLSLDFGYVASELGALAELCHAGNAKLKVIFENCYLSDAHKLRLCELSAVAGADWVKTSTGFGSGGATLDDVRLMREHSPPEVAVKASGGMRTLDDVLTMRPYVTRVGLSRTREILDECKRRLGLATGTNR
jgi:deoxyribose-phosphate aldolase